MRRPSFTPEILLENLKKFNNNTNAHCKTDPNSIHTSNSANSYPFLPPSLPQLLTANLLTASPHHAAPSAENNYPSLRRCPIPRATSVSSHAHNSHLQTTRKTCRRPSGASKADPPRRGDTMEVAAVRGRVFVCPSVCVGVYATTRAIYAAIDTSFSPLGTEGRTAASKRISCLAPCGHSQRGPS